MQARALYLAERRREFGIGAQAMQKSGRHFRQCGTRIMTALLGYRHSGLVRYRLAPKGMRECCMLMKRNGQRFSSLAFGAS